VVLAPPLILKEVTVGNWAKMIDALTGVDMPVEPFTLKYTVFVPLLAWRVKEGAVEYVFHAAPEKEADSLAMYFVGGSVAVLFSVTARLAVVAAPLFIKNDVTAGAAINCIVSLTAVDSPALFFTLK
jgi:hypothetical protein